MNAGSVPGMPVWIDMMTSDEAETRAFYTGLFGWEAGEGSPDFGGYFMFLRDGVPVAGVAPLMPDEEPPGEWTVYLATDDVEKTLELAESAGSEIIVPATDIADMGTMAVITDAAGARVAMWQAGTFPGFAVRGEVGTQSWFELHTLDYDANVSFYRDVFGWDTHPMSDTPEFRYTTLGEGEHASAGIMDASAYAAVSEWGVYIQVENTDECVAQAISLRGSQVQEPRDTPYGRLAEVADTTGCRIKLMGPNTES